MGERILWFGMFPQYRVQASCNIQMINDSLSVIVLRKVELGIYCSRILFYRITTTTTKVNTFWTFS